MALHRFITSGLRRIHTDAARREFLDEVWRRRTLIRRWMSADAYLDSRFESDYLPTFLHGGSSDGRIVVMGINPGWNQTANGDYEEPFKQQSARAYVDFHERFFEVFPALILGGMRHSPWWTKLANVMSGLLDDEPPRRERRFGYLQQHVVVQDLIPFHSARDLVRPSEVSREPLLKAITDATLSGLQSSDARMVMAFSRQGRDLIAPSLDHREDSELTGGRGKAIVATTGYLGRTPTLLVGNQILVQPAFPYTDLIPQLQQLMRRFN